VTDEEAGSGADGVTDEEAGRGADGVTASPLPGPAAASAPLAALPAPYAPSPVLLGQTKELYRVQLDRRALSGAALGPFVDLFACACGFVTSDGLAHASLYRADAHASRLEGAVRPEASGALPPLAVVGPDERDVGAASSAGSSGAPTSSGGPGTAGLEVFAAGATAAAGPALPRLSALLWDGTGLRGRREAAAPPFLLGRAGGGAGGRGGGALWSTGMRGWVASGGASEAEAELRLREGPPGWAAGGSAGAVVRVAVGRAVARGCLAGGGDVVAGDWVRVRNAVVTGPGDRRCELSLGEASVESPMAGAGRGGGAGGVRWSDGDRGGRLRSRAMVRVGHDFADACLAQARAQAALDAPGAEGGDGGAGAGPSDRSSSFDASAGPGPGGAALRVEPPPRLPGDLRLTRPTVECPPPIPPSTAAVLADRASRRVRVRVVGRVVAVTPSSILDMCVPCDDGSGATRWQYRLCLDVVDPLPRPPAGADAAWLAEQGRAVDDRRQRGLRVVFAGSDAESLVTRVSACDLRRSSYACEALRRLVRALLDPRARVDLVARVDPAGGDGSAVAPDSGRSGPPRPRLQVVAGCDTAFVA